MSTNTLPEGAAFTESLNSLTEKNILTSFRDLVSTPDILGRIKEKIHTMDNGIPKNLLLASLRRIENIQSGAEDIHRATQKKLQMLLTTVEDSANKTA